MPLDISRIKALCFDVDGTLSDTDDYYANKVVAFLPRFLLRDPVQQPAVIFLHYYGTGPAAQLARGVRAAVDRLGTSTAATH